MEYDVMQEIEELFMFQKIKKRNRGKELEKEIRKPWRKIQKEKQKAKYSLLQSHNIVNYNEGLA